jgi:hypothetical protein
LLQSERKSCGRGTIADGISVRWRLLHQVKQSRFEPAQALTGRKVAVNMVWMIAGPR